MPPPLLLLLLLVLGVAGADNSATAGHGATASSPSSPPGRDGAIDRRKVVARHFPTINDVSPTDFLALGNGQFGTVP